jgi:hypothetical protein
MAYVAPTTRSVGDAVTAADYNIMANDVINLRGLANVQSGFSTSTDGIANNATYVDATGLTVTITPTANTSKIFIIAHMVLGASTATIIGARIMRDATAIGVGATAGSRIIMGISSTLSGASNNSITVPISFLDSPATTSAITYKIQLNTLGGTVYLNRSGTDLDNTSYWRSASSITVMEIPA